MEIEYTFIDWLNDNPIKMPENYKRPGAITILTLYREGLIDESEFNNILEYQDKTFDMAVEINLETEKRIFKKEIIKAPNKKKYFSNLLETVKERFDNSESKAEVLRGAKHTGLLSGSDYKNIKAEYDVYFETNKWHSFYLNSNMMATVDFLFIEWLEHEANINPATSSEQEPTIKHKNPTTEDDIKTAFEIIEPLKGYWKRTRILTDTDFERLKNYIESIIRYGRLPEPAKKFPTTGTTTDFIRKTIYEVYRKTGKKNRQLFIELIHLFRQFENTETTTTDSKFSNYNGNYKTDKETLITY